MKYASDLKIGFTSDRDNFLNTNSLWQFVLGRVHVAA